MVGWNRKNKEREEGTIRFNKWFDSLPEQEQIQYLEEQRARYTQDLKACWIGVFICAVIFTLIVWSGK